jgi:hypothetical protein
MKQLESGSLRRELDRVGGRRRGSCFPKELKQRASEWIVKQSALVVSVAQIAEELGLSPGTVLRWSSELKTTRAMVPVRIVAEQRSERLVSAVSPLGFRIEGLTVAEAAALLRAFG